MSFDITPTLIAALSSAVAAALSMAISVLSRRLYSGRSGASEISLAHKEEPDPETQTRVREARTVLARQENIAEWNRRADSLLTFSQYIVGGVLASSFLQSALAPELIGFLGIVVLASKLIHQHYRPDLSSRGAKHRAIRLKQLIRTAEDGLYAIHASQKDAPTLLAIRTKMSDGLSEIERAELQDSSRGNSRRETDEQPRVAYHEKHAETTGGSAEA